jgi:hypothetical protein
MDWDPSGSDKEQGRKFLNAVINFGFQKRWEILDYLLAYQEGHYSMDLDIG